MGGCVEEGSVPWAAQGVVLAPAEVELVGGEGAVVVAAAAAVAAVVAAAAGMEGLRAGSLVAVASAPHDRNATV